MLKVLGVLLMIGSVVFGLWAGGYWAFVGGIIQIIEGVTLIAKDGAGAASIAWGLLRVAFAGFIGVVSFYVLFLTGAGLWEAGESSERRKRWPGRH